MSEIITTYTSRKNHKIIFRIYNNDDSQKMINLEENARQVDYLCGLITAGKIFTMPFDSKAKKYKDYIILVAEHVIDDNKRMICAGVALAIKDIYMDQEKVKAGYIFDLRVHKDYQGIGLGYQFSITLEKLAKEKGISYFYLSVNQTNQKAINLYKKLNFVTISERCIYGYNISLQQKQPITESKFVTLDLNHNLKLNFRKCSNQESKEILEKYYYMQDMSLQNMDELLNMDTFLGFYIAESEDKQNYAGICLSRIDTDNKMSLTRLFISPHIYFKIWFQVLILGILHIFGLLIYQRIQNNLNVDQSLQYFISGLVSFCFMLIICFIFIKLNRLFGTFCDNYNVGRCFAPIYFGGSKLKTKLIEYLYDEIVNIARNKNMVSLMFNFDINDSLHVYFPNVPKKKRSQAIFMGKYLEDRININIYNKLKNTNDILFDPRDF